MRQIDEAVVGILANSLVSRQVAVVNPHVCRLIDGDRVTVSGKNFRDFQVPDYHVLLTENGEPDPGESWRTSVSPR